MIEFKAACGHAIRAKEDDEGKVVRCPYCGREAEVPYASEDDFDPILADLGDHLTKGGTPIRRKSRKSRDAPIGGRPGRKGQFDVIALVFKMIYAAVIVSVLIVVGKMAYYYWQQTDPRIASKETSKEDDSDSGSRTRSRGSRDSRGSDRRNNDGTGGTASAGGLLTAQLDWRKQGMYINSVPTNLDLRVREVRDTNTGEIFDDPSAMRNWTDAAIELRPGAYEVAVAVRTNHPLLMSFRDPDYAEVRRLIESGRGDAVLDEYFLGGSMELFPLDRAIDGYFIVAFDIVQVTAGEFTPVSAMFLPNISLERLMEYLPRQVNYAFNDDHAVAELRFYGVPTGDRQYLIDALHRVGSFAYPVDDGNELLRFQVHLRDGSLTARRAKPLIDADGQDEAVEGAVPMGAGPTP